MALIARRVGVGAPHHDGTGGVWLHDKTVTIMIMAAVSTSVLQMCTQRKHMYTFTCMKAIYET